MFLSIKRLLKNTVFRLSMVAAGMFSASSLIVLGYIYYATVTSELGRIDRNMSAEMDELTEVFTRDGPDGLNRVIFDRMSREGTTTFYIYDNNGQLSFNLNAQPLFASEVTEPIWRKIPGRSVVGVRKFVYSVADPLNPDAVPATLRARGIFKQLSPTVKLFIARDVERIMSPAERVTQALLVSFVLALSLGLISGIYVSSSFARRIAAFNKLATDVRAGDLMRRAPRNDSGDELDVLAEHLNAMLDHIDTLMVAMRYAGDSIAHDLRSPLTRLQTRLDTAGAEVKDKVAREAILQASEDAGELLRTFESVLRIARLETGERRELLVPLDPQLVLEDIAELYEPSCEDVGLDFALEIEGKHKIRGDRGLLSQAVSNLVENAIKYTPPGGAITVRLRKARNGRSEISITDTGPGIPAGERGRVKERFVRLETSRTAPGSGLGLALVDAVADLHRAQFDLGDGPGGPDAELPGLRASLTFPRFKR